MDTYEHVLYTAGKFSDFFFKFPFLNFGLGWTRLDMAVDTGWTRLSFSFKKLIMKGEVFQSDAREVRS